MYAVPVPEKTIVSPSAVTNAVFPRTSVNVSPLAAFCGDFRRSRRSVMAGSEVRNSALPSCRGDARKLELGRFGSVAEKAHAGRAAQ